MVHVDRDSKSSRKPPGIPAALQQATTSDGPSAGVQSMRIITAQPKTLPTSP